jgi:predicted dehydrogenase
MATKVRWGVLGVAKIAVTKVIPGMQQGSLCEVTAIASRTSARAQEAAKSLGIPKAYGSYEGFLADPDIDAVYIPLPNHLHVPWAIKAAEAGKHVLCEKPISLTVKECRKLIGVRDATGVKIGEAFMVHSHPQWLRAREIVRSGEIGEVRSILGAFSYFNDDPANVRNVVDYGGGGLMDIGCYPITMSRFILGKQPARVQALIERDSRFGTDRLTSALLDFGSCQAVFMCSTQLVNYQRMQILGTKGRIEIPIPFNAPPDRPSRIFVDIGGDFLGTTLRTEEFPTCNQYALQGDAFSRAILEGGEVPTTLENALGNMAVIEGLFRSERTAQWEGAQIPLT